MIKSRRYCFSVLIINLLVLIVCSSGVTYRKSNESSKNLLPLTFIHINDFHARFEETNELSVDCRKETNDVCIGGYARIVTVVKQLQCSRTNPIFFNAGDNFAGTIWYTFGKWNVTSHFLNLLRADVMTVGNHEFDNGIDELVPFLDSIQSPLILANIDLTDEPQLKGKFSDSIIITRGGRKVGIIGIIASDTNTISKTGKIKFLDEVESVRRESEKLHKEGIDIIVILSHAGIDVDLKIAREAGAKIDVIVGAHTHTFMYTGNNPPGPDKPTHDYPTIIKQDDGHAVLVVQASAFAKYVGDLTVYFDERGEALRWTGQPIFLGPNVRPDEHILEELKPWKAHFYNKSVEVIGTTEIILDQSNCMYMECIMGDVIADAFLHSYRIKTNDTKPTVALIQAGGVRNSMPRGSITFGELLMVLPFGNIVGSFDLLGQFLWDAMELSTNVLNDPSTNLKHMLQVSGMRLEVNTTKPEGSRVQSIAIICEECTPLQFKPIDLNQTYRVVATDFLFNGGQGYTMFSENSQNIIIGDVDVDALVNYIRSVQTLEQVETGRIIILE